MWIAQVAPAYVSRCEAFDDEAEAVAWLDKQMRASGTKQGVVFEVSDEGAGE